LVISANFIKASDESSLIRAREHALAKALNAKDRVMLSTLTYKNFHIYWTAISIERFFTVDERSDDWINDLIRLRIDDYEAKISEITLPSSEQAFVTLDESWSIHSPQGSRIEKRFATTDSWFKLQGTWKLVQRSCRPYLH
jgi:hypothetical protein